MIDIIENNFLLIILFLWGFPSTYFRSKFRKIVYKTDDWKINIKPLFTKEILGLFGNVYPNNKNYIKARDAYRLYLTGYFILFVIYSIYK
jgi:peroxiredoxin Q/BCP|tara:strand:- start:5200 stop:5469 length:270 start_codon:yes stop_codon:yes gene_type:complete